MTAMACGTEPLEFSTSIQREPVLPLRRTTLKVPSAVPASSLGSGSRLRDGKAALKARGEAEACVGALAPADECPASARTTHAL